MSFKQHQGRAAFLFVGGAAFLLLLAWLHLAQNNIELTFSFMYEVLSGERSTIHHEMVWSLYLPRIAVAIGAGMALAMAGILFQTLTQNPLAAPGTLGVNAGAYFFVIIGTVTGFGGFALSGFMYAFLGGILTAVLVFILAGGLTAHPVRMALAGMVLTLTFSSLTSALQIFFEYETAGLFLWGNGSLVQDDWSGFLFLLPVVVIVMLIAFMWVVSIDLLLIGSTRSELLGVHTNRLKTLLFVLAVLLTAATVSVTGPIGFVGLITPHIIRMLGFKRHFLLFALASIWGAVILVGADVLGRWLDPSLTELPVGSITALLGAPWLIWLLYRYQDSFSSLLHSKTGFGFKTIQLRFPYIVLLLGVCVMTVVVFIAGLMVGSQGFEWRDTVRAILQPAEHSGYVMLLEMRAGRLLAACLAGALLAVSGLLFQGVLRNPLADPSVLGVTGGAGAGAIILLFVSGLGAAWLPLGAFIGAFLSIGVVMLFGKRFDYHPAVLVLMGIAVSALGSAITQVLITRFNVNAAVALTWLSGSTYGSGFSEVYTYLVVPLIVMVPLAYLLAERLNMLSLGDANAASLGLNLSQTRWMAIVLATLGTSFAVSAVGTIGFVGLVAPHLARFVVGPNHQKGIFLSALFGGSLLMAADAIGRLILAPAEIPSGIIVTLIGAPFFFWFLKRTIKS
ncbi:iron ABC transporter permease [Salsuginibacillus kocurii]|uniref:iron ABC transporter permease n=1 Tax=Salsuginibacillus kocurii TaxID=427078 RepID=UPI00037EB07F|nr:iron ABC transporter permease [Salsuginibacillus kocurii]